MKHVAVKCRISKDDQGRGENVADQEEWGRAYAAEHWPDLPVEVYTDNDISAADRKTTRPEFDRFCAAVAAGKVAHVVTTNLKRITRDAAQWFDLCDELFLPAGIEEIHTKHRGVMRTDDLATDVDAVLGRRQIRESRQLIRDKMGNLAKVGRPGGGCKYGYRPGRNEAGEATMEIVPEEAAEVRLAAERVLSGWSLRSIVLDFQDRGVKTKRGGRWDVSSVKAILTKPSVAGLRVHQGEIVGKGTWDPILDEVTWRLVCSTLDTRKTVRAVNGEIATVPPKGPKHPRRRWLLTGGLLVCGRTGCGASLSGRNVGWGGSKKRPLTPYYVCPTSTRGGCGRLGSVIGYWTPEARHGVDGVVIDRLFANLRTPAFLEALAADDAHARRDDIVQQLAALESSRAELGRMWATRRIDAVGWQAASAELGAEHARLNGALAALPPPVVEADPESIIDAWEEMTLDERRHVLESFIDRIVLHPSTPGNRFDPDRVEIVWRSAT